MFVDTLKVLWILLINNILLYFPHCQPFIMNELKYIESVKDQYNEYPYLSV